MRAFRRSWVPRILTFGNLICGFVSLGFSARNTPKDFLTAASLILAAALLDGMDGQVARWLRTDDRLGKELDSLADCVSFGAAPGFLSYNAYLSGINLLVFGVTVDMGILFASFFPLCAAYRLARFGIQPSFESFSGLPAPGAAVLLVLIVTLIPSMPLLLFVVLFCLIALLMISTLTYSKPQAYVLGQLRGAKLAGVIIVAVLLFLFFGLRIILLTISVYALSGIIGSVIRFVGHYLGHRRR